MKHQEITVVITGFNPGYPNGPDHTVGKHDLRIAIDPTDEHRSGGWKSQEAEIEEMVVSGLNFVLEKLSIQRIGDSMTEQFNANAKVQIDGMLIGWRAHRISRHDTAYAQPTLSNAADLIRGVLLDFTTEDAQAILAQVAAAQ